MSRGHETQLGRKVSGLAGHGKEVKFSTKETLKHSRLERAPHLFRPKTQ